MGWLLCYCWTIFWSFLPIYSLSPSKLSVLAWWTFHLQSNIISPGLFDLQKWQFNIVTSKYVIRVDENSICISRCNVLWGHFHCYWWSHRNRIRIHKTQKIAVKKKRRNIRARKWGQKNKVKDIFAEDGSTKGKRRWIIAEAND